MKLREIEQEAVALPERERADLVCRLLDTLPPMHADVSDEEAMKRDRELETGEVEELSHDDFVKGVQKSRGR
jgi:hypothetical protein